MHTHTHTHTHTHVHTYIYRFVYVYVYVYICIYMYIYRVAWGQVYECLDSFIGDTGKCAPRCRGGFAPLRSLATHAVQADPSQIGKSTRNWGKIGPERKQTNKPPQYPCWVPKRRRAVSGTSGSPRASRRTRRSSPATSAQDLFHICTGTQHLCTGAVRC